MNDLITIKTLLLILTAVEMFKLFFGIIRSK